VPRATTKVKSLAAAVRAVRRAQAAGGRVVFTNGCFDLLHRGHTRYLEQARALGDFLVVAVNSDSSVRRLKGAGRPVVPARERAEVLAALAAVDLVLIFADLDPDRVIRAVRPDVLVKGGDWPVARIVGSDFVRSVGGKVRSLPYVKGVSTSELIRRIVSTASGQPAAGYPAPERGGAQPQHGRRKPSSRRRPTSIAAPAKADG
jgi:D-beta-D-heptose 7-phosphate kinase/D-beta-D-heptose 1-phosphate adenosyltransferase